MSPGGGRRRGGRRAPDSWGWGRALSTSRLPSLPPSLWPEPQGRRPWGAGPPTACRVGARWGQRVLEPWGFPELRSSEATAPQYFMPSIRSQALLALRQAQDPGLWTAPIFSTPDALPTPCWFRSPWGLGREGAHPLLQQLGMRFPFLMQEFPRNDGVLSPPSILFFLFLFKTLFI